MEENRFEPINQCKKRKRKLATKRWSTEQTEMLLNIVKDRADTFEKPTAQSYYLNILKDIEGLQEFPWGALKHKIRNLRTKYREAIDWRKNTKASLLSENEGKTVRDYILKFCPNFDIMDEIFGSKQNDNPSVAFDSFDQGIFVEDVNPLELFYEESSTPLRNQEETTYGENINDISNAAEDNNTSSERFKIQFKIKPQKITDRNENNSISYLVQMKEKRSHTPESKVAADFEMHRKRLASEKSKIETELSRQTEKFVIERERLAFEKEKFNVEINLKTLEIEKSFEFKKAQLESEERIKLIQLEKDAELKRFELELKYRCKNQTD